MTLSLLVKAKAAAQGEVRTWADGKQRKKVGSKWILVGPSVSRTVSKLKENVLKTSQQHFDFALTSNLGDTAAKVLQEQGINDFNDLVSKIKSGPADTAHAIYKQVVDRVNEELAPTADKRAVNDMIGRSLITLKAYFAEKPKTKLAVKKVSKTGKTYWESKSGKITEDLPPVKPTTIKKARKKMAGWSVTGILTSQHVQGMLKTGAAKLTYGKINAKRKWHMPVKAEDMELKYKGDNLLIHVKQVRTVNERTRATAKVDIKIPYAFAKAFLLKNISSKKTRNNFIFRMENSAGYREFLKKENV